MPPATTSATADAASTIAQLADQCVLCGLCLPHCPTYHVGRTEAESPRGRIAFAKGLATGSLDATPSVVRHLDQCLACGNCERVCPSNVQYGELLVRTRAELAQAGHSSGKWTSPSLLRGVMRLARVPGVRALAASALGQAMLKPFGWDRAARELPAIAAVDEFPRTNRVRSSRGRIGLFLGCAAEVVDRDVHAAASTLLAALGYETVPPHFSCCCGALAQHAGNTRKAAAAAAQARNAFENVETVLVSASGCFGTLRDAFAATKTQVRDIHEFIATDDRFDQLHFSALAQRAALHMPCTQTNVARDADAIVRLLRKIPQLEVFPLPSTPGCCGAAGSYFLEHPQIADALRSEKIDQTQAQNPDMLITSNVGCRIFLGNGLRQRGDALTVVHPIVLLARQLHN